jgi:nicotinamide-nucleotide amidase
MSDVPVVPLFTDAVSARAAKVLAALRARGWMVATAESCTGGLIAAALTAIAGSSDVVDRGFVTYSNAAKSAMLGVPEALIARFGAVSEPVARAMACGALLHSKAHVAIAVTGIAGPGGGSADKPVGLVWLACADHDGGMTLTRQVFAGDRAAVRHAAVAVAFDMLVAAAAADTPGT